MTQQKAQVPPSLPNVETQPLKSKDAMAVASSSEEGRSDSASEDEVLFVPSKSTAPVTQQSSSVQPPLIVKSWQPKSKDVVAVTSSSRGSSALRSESIVLEAEHSVPPEATPQAISLLVNQEPFSLSHNENDEASLSKTMDSGAVISSEDSSDSNSSSESNSELDSDSDSETDLKKGNFVPFTPGGIETQADLKKSKSTMLQEKDSESESASASEELVAVRRAEDKCEIVDKPDAVVLGPVDSVDANEIKMSLKPQVLESTRDRQHEIDLYMGQESDVPQESQSQVELEGSSSSEEEEDNKIGTSVQSSQILGSERNPNHMGARLSASLSSLMGSKQGFVVASQNCPPKSPALYNRRLTSDMGTKRLQNRLGLSAFASVVSNAMSNPFSIPSPNTPTRGPRRASLDSESEHQDSERDSGASNSSSDSESDNADDNASGTTESSVRYVGSQERKRKSGFEELVREGMYRDFLSSLAIIC